MLSQPGCKMAAPVDYRQYTEAIFFFKQKTAYELGLGIPAEPLFRSYRSAHKFMRASIKMIGVSNLQSFIASMTQKLTLSDISDRSEERRVGKECRSRW